MGYLKIKRKNLFALKILNINFKSVLLNDEGFKPHNMILYMSRIDIFKLAMELVY